MIKQTLFLSLVLLSLTPLKAQTISLSNGGFESSLNNWTTEGNGVTYSISTAGIHSGSKMLNVVVTNVGTTAAPVKITHDPFETSSSRIYMVRFWAKASQANSQIALNLKSETQTTTCKFKVDNVFGTWTNGWQMYQFLFKAPNSPVTMDFTFKNVGTYMIDDVEVLDDTHPVLDLQTQYMWQNNLKGYGWLSGDNDVSVLLPDGRTAWIFSDSFVGTNYTNESFLRSGTMVNNLIVVQEGVNKDTLRTVMGGTVSSPSALVTPITSGHLYWVTDGFVENDTLKVMYNEWTGDFQNKVGVACFRLPELTLIKRITPSYNHTDIPNALLSDGDYIYIYMVQRTDNPFERYTRIARIPKGTMNNTSTVWEYYTDNSIWSTDFTLAKRIVSGVEAASVRKLGEGNYVMSGVPHLSRDIAVWYAPTPWGPWGNKKVLYTRPDEAGVLGYLGHMHECAGTADGEYVLSTSLYPFGGYVPQQRNDKGTYLPIYIKANLKKWSPFTSLDTPKKDDDLTINLYPNPVGDVLNVERSNSGEVLGIYDLSGVLLRRFVGNMFDVSDLNPGGYLLKGKTQSRLFIKK